MRLDLFLKVSRLCPRRTVAQQMCEAGRVLVNGGAAKSSHIVKPGDELELRSRSKIRKVRVLTVPSTRQIARKDAADLTELISDVVLDELEV